MAVRSYWRVVRVFALVETPGIGKYWQVLTRGRRWEWRWKMECKTRRRLIRDKAATGDASKVLRLTGPSECDGYPGTNPGHGRRNSKA